MRLVRWFAAWRKRAADADQELFCRAMAVAALHGDLASAAEFREHFDEALSRSRKWAAYA